MPSRFDLSPLRVAEIGRYSVQMASLNEWKVLAANCRKEIEAIVKGDGHIASLIGEDARDKRLRQLRRHLREIET